MLSSRSCIKSALPPLTPLTLTIAVDQPPVHSPPLFYFAHLTAQHQRFFLYLSLSLPFLSLFFLLSPACRPDRVALLPSSTRTDAPTNPLPCRPMSSLSAVHFSLPQACQPDVSPTISYYYQHCLILHRYCYSHIYYHIDSTFLQRRNGGAARQGRFETFLPSSLHPSDPSPYTADDAWCCRAAVYTRAPSLSFYRFPPFLFPLSSNLFSSYSSCAPSFAFLSASHWAANLPVCLPGLPDCLARLLTCLHASLPARLLACLLGPLASFNLYVGNLGRE